MWTHLGALNRQQLERGGLDHFKRSVNQNYFNWLPQSLSNNQVRRVLRRWLRRPSLRPLLARMAPLGALEGFAHDRPLDDRVSRLVYKLYVALLWDLARREDRAGLIDHLSEPLEGDPIRIRYRGRFVSEDWPTPYARPTGHWSTSRPPRDRRRSWPTSARATGASAIRCSPTGAAATGCSTYHRPC